MNPTSVQKRKDTMSVKQTAEYLGCCSDTVYTMARKNEIPHFKVRSRIFFSKTTIDAWISEQEISVSS